MANRLENRHEPWIFRRNIFENIHKLAHMRNTPRQAIYSL